MPYITRRSIIQDFALHFVFNVLFSALIYLASHNLAYIFVFVSISYALDLDHLIDYFLFFKSGLDLKGLLYLDFLQSGKVYYFLHSWEISCLLLGAALVSRSDIALIASLSLLTHIFTDSLQKRNPFFYFLVYRFAKKFDAAVLNPDYFK
jgi:hypothetical protein